MDRLPIHLPELRRVGCTLPIHGAYTRTLAAPLSSPELDSAPLLLQQPLFSSTLAARVGRLTERLNDNDDLLLENGDAMAGAPLIRIHLAQPIRLVPAARRVTMPRKHGNGGGGEAE